jgi:hypothetical protein
MAFLSNIKVLWITIIILILLNLVTVGALWVTRTHNPYPRFDKKRHNREYFLHDKLKLNADQLQKYKEIRINQHHELGEKQDSIRYLREKLMCQMKKRDLNDSSRMLIEKIGQVQSEIERMNYEHFRQILGICDSTQKVIFIETMKKAFMPGHDENHPPRQPRRNRGDN